MNQAVRGSTYEDYDTTSNSFDGVRIPAGLALHKENLASGARPLAQQHVVELGCGTANYSHALRGSVRRMDGFDGSLGMLARARAKLGEGHVARAFLPHLPLRSASVDGV